MWNISDRSFRTPRFRWPVRGVLVALVVALWASVPVAGQDAPSGSDARTDLRAEIEEVYEVQPTEEGLLLRPLEEYRGVRSLEIEGSTLSVNGEEVSREEAQGWLGERAEPVLELLDLSEAERERLYPGAEADEATAEVGGEEAREPGDVEEAAEAEEAEAMALEAPEIPEPPEPPEPPRAPRVRRGSQTVVGSTVRIAPDEVAEDVVAFGGSVVVQGRVEGDVTAFGGNVDVDGEVTRDVTAIGGNVRLGEDAEVGGDATSVGGHVSRAPGARVRGRIEEVDRGWGRGWHSPLWGWNWWDGWDGPRWSAWSWFWSLAWPLAEVLFLALLMMVAVAIGRPTVERVGIRGGSEPVKSGVVGLLVAVLTVPVLIIVSVLLAVSIIGIPILIVLILLFVFVGVPGLLVMALVGYTGISWRLGRWTEGRFGWRLESPYMAVLVGLLFLHGLEVIGQALDFGPLKPFAVMFLVMGSVVQLVAGCVGFGAVFLLLHERRTRRRAAALMPPPPPHSPPPAETETPPPPVEPGGSGEAPPEGEPKG